jgi:hypothetical protein
MVALDWSKALDALSEKRATSVPVLLLSALAAALAALSILVPNTYSNLWTPDLLYLLNAGYLIHHGFVPHVDFRWQFGGYETYLIAAAFRLFGETAKAGEQAIALGFFVTLLLFNLGMYRKVRLATYALLLALITAISLTWYPLERGSVDVSVQTFSMYYNRLCWASSIALFAILAASREPLARRQILACALLVFVIVTTKITFALLVLPAVVLLIYRNGVRGLLEAAGFWLAAAAAAWLFLGYGPQAHIGTIGDILDATSDARGLGVGPLHKLVNITFYNWLGISIAVALLALGAFHAARQPWRFVKLGTLLAVLAFSLLVGVTTGPFYAFTAVVPMMPALAVIAADELFGDDRRSLRIVAAAAGYYALLFAVPYLLNYAAGIAKQGTRGEQSVFPSGPLRGLIIDKPDANTSPTFKSKDEALHYIGARLRLEGNMAWAGDYEWQYTVADAIELASGLPDVRERRVLTFYMSTMPFALSAKPVTSFSLLASRTAPSVQALTTVPAEVDTVLILRDDRENPLHKRFAQSLAEQFVVRGRSPLWDLYVRKPA